MDLAALDATITAENYTVALDLPDGPTVSAQALGYPTELFQVSGIRISYHNRSVTAIQLSADGMPDLYVTPAVPEAWPEWLHTLVDQYRP